MYNNLIKFVLQMNKYLINNLITILLIQYQSCIKQSINGKFKQK